MQMIRKCKRQLTEEKELLEQENIRTLGEKETYKYLGILEADTFKKAEMKEKIYTSGERENYTKPNYIAEISSKL